MWQQIKQYVHNYSQLSDCFIDVDRIFEMSFVAEGSPRDSSRSISSIMSLRSLSSPEIFKGDGDKIQSNVGLTLVKPQAAKYVSKDVNSAPQDFVLVDGSAYKITRASSPRNNDVKKSSSNPSEDVPTLQKALMEAHRVINAQERDIERLTAQIAALEKQVQGSSRPSTSSSSTLSITLPPSDSLTLSPHSAARKQSILTVRTSGDSSLLPPTLQRDISGLTEEDYITPKAEQALQYQALEGVLGSLSAPHPKTSISSAMLPVSSPRLALSDSGLSLEPVADECRKLSVQSPRAILSHDVSSAKEDKIVIMEDLLSPARQIAAAAPKGLTERLSMNSQERRKLAATKRLRGLPKASPSSGADPGSLLGSDSATSSPARVNVPKLSQLRPRTTDRSPLGDSKISDRETFTRLRESANAELRTSATMPSTTRVDTPSTIVEDQFRWSAGRETFLFVLHDNPQIGFTAASQISSASCGNTMGIMIESKDSKGITYFLVGRIFFSGGLERIEGSDPSNPRGSQCLVCGGLTGYRVDLKALPTRIRGEIQEIDITSGGPDSVFVIDSREKLTSFFKPCAASRVDVILDPTHTKNWYPYWEGKRKMAPQFRSKGIGYIRLGDDMSMFGCAFLSTDAGITFLDHGEAQEWNVDIENDRPLGSSGGSRPRSTSSYSTTSSDSGANNRRRVAEELKDIVSRLRGLSSSGTLSANGLGSEGSDRELKWSDRVELIGRLSMHLSIIVSGAISLTTSFDPPSLLSEVISSLDQHISGHTNPHVVRACIQCMRILGGGERGLRASRRVDLLVSLNTCGMAWRSLLLNCIHSVRAVNKSISDDAREALDSLHGITLSIGGLIPNLEEVVSGPRSRTTTSSGAANTSKVVNWLNQLLRSEFSLLLNRTLGIVPYSDVGIVSPVSSPGTDVCDVTSSSTASTPRPKTGNSVNTKPSDEEMFFDKIDCVAGIQRCKHLLWHREELTRESAVGLIAAFLSHDIFLTGALPVSSVTSSGSYSFSGGMFTVARQLSRRTAGDVAMGSNRGLIISAVTGGLSLPCKAILTDIDKSSQRMFEKVISSVADMITAAATSVSTLLTSNLGSVAEQPSPRRPFITAPSATQNSPRQTPRGETSSSSSSSSVYSAIPKPQPPSTDVSKSLESISNLWFEATCVLKQKPKSEADWNHITSVIHGSQIFFPQMTACAKSAGMPRGALLQVVLPFDNATSLADQAATAHAAPLPNIPGVARDTLIALRDQAVAIRRLIRVKMADEADLQQAMASMSLLYQLSLSMQKMTLPPINMELKDLLAALK